MVRPTASLSFGEDARNRLAAKTLLIDLATACEQLDDFQAHAPDLWKAIERTRDKMAHHYRDTNFTRVWETISVHVPTVLEQILRPGAGPGSGTCGGS